MTEFQKITASPEALTELLASILTTDGPVGQGMRRKLTAPTVRGRTATAAPHDAEDRTRILWWLTPGGCLKAGGRKMTIYIKSEENGWEVERQIDLPDDEKLVRSIMRSIKKPHGLSEGSGGGVLSQRLRRTSRRRNAGRTFRRAGPRRRPATGDS